MLAIGGSRVYALVPTLPQTVVVTDLALRVKSRFRVPTDVKYRGIVRAGGRTYVFGYREGRIVDPVAGLRESDAVVTRVGTDVRAFKVGDEVYARPRDLRIGTFAEYIAIDQADLASSRAHSRWKSPPRSR